ncbi:MAG: aminoglycoside phosphotransferase family protein [Candidatus Tectimicrobiota bacterium]
MRTLETLRTPISSQLAWIECRPVEAFDLEGLPGDASDRTYVRVRYRIDGAPRSYVIMVTARPFDPGLNPFLDVAAHLQANDVPVPAIIGANPALGLVVIEDVGDETLEAFVARQGLEAARPLYDEALDLLVKMQVWATEGSPERCVALRRAFDVERYVWELEFFVEHMIEGLRGRAVAPAHRQALQEEFTRLSRFCVEQPQVFAHRDYHSRNLMVQDGRLRVLDFQDARLGCRAYDLASLLRDSYVALPEEMVEELFAAYLAKWAEATGLPVDPETFRELFDHMAVQRNLKAVGTFASQWRLYGRDYRRYIPPTLASARANLAKYDDLARLQSLLSAYLEEVA